MEVKAESEKRQILPDCDCEVELEKKMNERGEKIICEASSKQWPQKAANAGN